MRLSPVHCSARGLCMPNLSMLSILGHHVHSDTHSHKLMDDIIQKLVWKYLAYSLIRPLSLSQNSCLIVVLDQIKVVVRNPAFSDKIHVLLDTGQ